ncbi:cysteine-rich CWC family protein [uncultured Thiodictyon sp.]|uniref:cysteine-rich CWC family protein n=1 Tax=uncultured Thiodictyon sp. TaxID=1846217 RepID=UPI0025DB63AC|nr:cysteine-rich CWC family protein [uncultured Thiodictyon sp.]
MKTCPRCGRAFECKLDDPVHCDCARVELSAPTRSAIQAYYRDCLCLNCLTALAAGAAPSARI